MAGRAAQNALLPLPGLLMLRARERLLPTALAPLPSTPSRESEIMPAVHVNPSLPLEITVDFQSIHRAGFRLFTRQSAEDQWTFLKQGIEDTTTTSVPLRVGGALQYEFIYFKEAQEFAAVLVFRQNGQSIDGSPVRISAPGDETLVVGQVDLA
jgi:hypothetical protein